MSTLEAFLGYDPHKTEAIEELGEKWEIIPEGVYKVAGTELKKQTTKNGKGWYWYLKVTIIGGDYDGKTLEHRFNIVNPNEDAERIGKGQMRRFLEAVGVLEPKNEDCLLNISFMVKVICKKNNYTNSKGKQIEGMSNEITRFDPLDKGDTAQAKPQAATTGATEKAVEPSDDSDPWG